jgi:DNA-binding Xre family transcriptional regulator
VTEGTSHAAFFKNLIASTLANIVQLYYNYSVYGSVDISGGRLRQLRVQRAISQEDLGRMTGIAQSTISNLESSNRPARLSTIRKLAQALEVEPSELMKEE